MKIMVLGAGTMGAGIAQVAAQSGFDVILRDIKQEFVDNGLKGIDKNLSRLVEKRRLEAAAEAQWAELSAWWIWPARRTATW